MRIEQESRNLYVGTRQATQTRTKEEIEEGLKNGRVFSGKIGFHNDIEERRKLAQEEAMGIVKAAFFGEQEIDESIVELEDNIEKYREEMLADKAELNRMHERKENLEKNRGELTPEEYASELELINEAEKFYSKKLADNQQFEDRTIQAITDIGIERAKSNPMVDASKEAEAVLADAGKEIVGELFEEAKEHMDAENDKKQAEAEEKAAKEKELEERIEAMKAEKEEREEAETPGMEQFEVATRRMVKIAETGEIVQKELKSVVDRMKLDLEDLKGAAVDSEV